MPRIIAGAAGGRRLAAPAGRDTRPTADRVREAMFSSVQSELRTLDGVRVLDLFAGSGALGLEALSRGAAEALLVESDRRAVQVIRRNIAEVGLPGARVRQLPARRLASRRPDGAGYDLVLADPPYAQPAAELAALLGELAATGWPAPGALVVLERSSRDPDFPWPPGYRPGRVRRYGEAALWYGHAAGDHAVAAPNDAGMG